MASSGYCLSLTLTLLLLPQIIFCDCPESIFDFNKTIIDNANGPGHGPLNATEYVGGTATFTGTVPSTCHLLRLYIDGCYSSKINVNITTIGNMKKLSYVTPVLNMSHDGTTYDVCTHCGDHYECFPTAYLKVKDKPVLNVNAIATCNGILVEGQKDNDTVIMTTVKDSHNHTVHHCNISTLPYLINYTVLPDGIDFNIEFVGVNPAGVGEPLKQTVSFENLMYFKIKTVKVLFEDNKVKAIIRFSFNNTCSMSRPHAVHVKSTCVAGGSRSFSISNTNTITVDLLHGSHKCNFTLSTGKTSYTTTSYDTRPITATIHPHNTTDGYFYFTGRLLQGVPGMVIQVVTSNGTIHSTQYIARDGPHDNYVKGSNTKQLEDGSYRVNIYLMKANKTFDALFPIKKIQIYCVMPMATPITTPETEIHKNMTGFTIGLIIFAIAVVALIVVSLPFCLLPKLQGIVKYRDLKGYCFVFDSQWLMGIKLIPFLSFDDKGNCQSSKEDCRYYNNLCENKSTVGVISGNESAANTYSKPEPDIRASETDGNQSTINSTPYVSFQSESALLLTSPGEKNEQYLNQALSSGPSDFVGSLPNALCHTVVNTLDQKPMFPVPVASSTGTTDAPVIFQPEIRKRKLSRTFSQEGQTKQQEIAPAAFVSHHEIFDAGVAGDKK